HPRRRPLVAWHPEPAETALERPSAVVINDPAPVGLDVVGHPVPAPFIRVDPVPVLIRPPIGRDAGGHPNITEARMWRPHTVLLERDLSIFGYLPPRLPPSAPFTQTQQPTTPATHP